VQQAREKCANAPTASKRSYADSFLPCLSVAGFRLGLLLFFPRRSCAMFVKQATTDRLLGMLVTLATGAAIFYIQVSLW